MNKKVKLYTCDSGLNMSREGLPFFVWYKEDAVPGDYALFVFEDDVDWDALMVKCNMDIEEVGQYES